MSKYVKPLLAAVVYLLVQGVVCLVALAIEVLAVLRDNAARTGARLFDSASFPEEMPAIPYWGLAAIVIVSGIITVALLAKPIGLVRFPRAFDARTVCWRKVLTAVVGCVAGVLACNLIVEHLHLPNLAGDDLEGMMDNMLGILAVGVVGPIVEEAVFREALLGDLLLRKVKPWPAIIISALVFGVIHANPAQIPGAAMIGLMLGIVYWRTGNIVLPSLLHMANNLFCVAQYHVLGDASSTFTLTRWMGGGAVALPVMALSLGICVAMLTYFVRNYPQVSSPANSDDDLLYS